ncbi:MAG: hypothetical protein HZB56_13195 [Deltaproteobacteria bacterium]|nr:hypothetical protein [Deltaproteobacteria bacterium]
MARTLPLAVALLLPLVGRAGPPAPSFRGEAPVGVWMGSTLGRMRSSGLKEVMASYDASLRKVEWRVLFAGGLYFRGLPQGGLADLDVARSQREGASGRFIGGHWGRWSFGGGRGTGTVPGSPDEALALLGPDRLQVDGRFDFVRAADVDDLLLEGGYTGMTDPDDPYFAEPGCRQMIWFTPDGRFTDRGAFVSDCRRPEADPALAPGSGRYEIRDFTLLLRHADGRLARHALTGVVHGDPRADARMLFVDGHLWRRRAGPAPAPQASIPAAPSAAVPLEPGRTTFGLFSFVAPTGWKEDRGRDAVGYTSVDQGARTFCQVAVYAGRPGSGDGLRDFALDWADVVEQGKRPDARPEPEPGRTAGGLPFHEGGSMLAGPSGRYAVALLVFGGRGQRASLLFSSGTEESLAECRQKLAPMLASLRLAGG